LPQKEQPSTSWAIYIARSRPAKWLGTVEAPNADAAIEEAVKQFKVADARKLVAVRQQRVSR